MPTERTAAKAGGGQKGVYFVRAKGKGNFSGKKKGKKKSKNTIPEIKNKRSRGVHSLAVRKPGKRPQSKITMVPGAVRSSKRFSTVRPRTKKKRENVRNTGFPPWRGISMREKKRGRDGAGK